MMSMAEILSEIAKFNSPYQLVALLLLLAFLVVISTQASKLAGVICWVISLFAKVNISTSNADTQIDVHLEK